MPQTFRRKRRKERTPSKPELDPGVRLSRGDGGKGSVFSLPSCRRRRPVGVVTQGVKLSWLTPIDQTANAAGLVLILRH